MEFTFTNEFITIFPKFFQKDVDNATIIVYSIFCCEKHINFSEMRKCRNWQTSKTKDLVAIAVVWVQVPSSAVKMSAVNKAEMPYLSHFLLVKGLQKMCKNVYTFLHSSVGLYIQGFLQFVTFLLV